MKKEIHVFFVNKLKNLDGKIYDEEDQDYPDRRKTSAYQREYEKWLDKAGIKDGELRQEIKCSIQWCDDDCVGILESKGWTVLAGKETLPEKWRKNNESVDLLHEGEAVP